MVGGVDGCGGWGKQASSFICLFGWCGVVVGCVGGL